MYESTATCNVNYWVMSVTPKRILAANDIIEATCRVFKITKQALLSKCRDRYLVRARNICITVIKDKLHMALTDIGKLFNRDHTTVIHALRTVENDLSVPAYRQEINEQINAVIQLL